MLDSHTWIYTRRGWLKYNEVQPGDTTISYNEYRGCTEYDTITDVEIEDYDGPIINLTAKSICLKMTPDHQFSAVRKFGCKRLTAENVFFTFIRTVLQCEMFEPYSVTRDIEDVKWAARLAAHFSTHKTMPDSVAADIKMHSDELAGNEAYEWIKTFYGWTIKRPYAKGFGQCALISNPEIKNWLFEIAPRAGLGAFWRVGNRPDRWGMHVTKTGNTHADLTAWGREHIERPVFNLQTTNGTFLSRTHGRVSLGTCRKEK